MLKKSQHHKVKKMFGKAMFTVLVMASAAVSKAQSTEAVTPIPPSTFINYLGTHDDMFVFGIQHYNDKKNKFTVEIKENSGNVLFKEAYTDMVFSKSFKIPRDLDGKLNFVIKDLKENVVETFEVNTNIRVTEHVIVTKL